MRILLTGASGCIGHYMAEALIQETDHELFLLVRDPQKLRFDFQARPGVTLLQGDLGQVQQFSSLLKTMDQAILAATAWGGQDTFEVNVTQTLALMALLDPSHCQQVLYFSTASILNRQNQLLPEAGQLGTDYIRSKYQCFQQLSQLAIAPRIRILFPTLVLGGDEHKPYSHLSAGIPEVLRWLNLIRWFRAEGSFHFIHGRDIAQVVSYLVDHPVLDLPDPKLVLGSPVVKVNQAITEFCAYFNQPIYFRIPLTLWLANVLIRVFRIQMDEWSYFSLQYRHFTYRHPITPATFGLPIYCGTISDMLTISGMSPRKS
ncbi:epimerase [Neosynechococcus sphagnicola sy1]|uniref:Epimerase n=1 Tax=Neosynechococcus sphagnicola sy1 TaxID=1497020 RepID=A0A098TLH9_9CYAN|nr:NAD(P)-dependent oxidoreductase [Neosynechococcus sphagnicola]KGF71703.1 epimerase [Neosynechococcus sphagnicola sy1]